MVRKRRKLAGEGRATRMRARRPGRLFVVLFICAGLAYLGVITGDDYRSARARRDPMVGFYPPDMPRYPAAQEVAAGRTRVGRLPLRMSYFSTKHEPQRVGDYYAAFWRKHGFWVNSDVTHIGGVVAAVDAHKGHVYQVLLRRQGKSTLVFPSVNTAPMSSLRRGDALPLRLFKDSKILANTVTRAGRQGAQILLSTNAGTLEENRQYYRAELGRGGFREERVSDEARKKIPATLRENILVYRNAGGGELTLVLSKLDDAHTRVHLTTIGVRR